MQQQMWKRASLSGLLFVCFSLLLAGCGTFYELPDVAKGDRDSLVDSNTDFTFALHRQLSKDEKGNLFYSPYSISSALAMTYAGAKGETAKQIAATFRWKLEGDKLHAAQSWLMMDLHNRGQKGNYALHVANRLWGEKTDPFEKAFLDTVGTRYLAPLQPLDFINAPEPSRKIINTWVEEQTRGKITNLLPEGSIKKNTSLVLTNAIYFKGVWDKTFKKEDTKERQFTVSSSRKVNVPTMTRKLDDNAYGEFNIAEDDTDKDGKVQILTLPYKSKELAMVILLPTLGSMEKLEARLSASQLKSWMDKMDVPGDEIKLYLPRFKMTQRFRLKKALSAMGMKVPFEGGKADFSGMNGKKNLFIDSIHHKAFVEVNEEGTEAAAATGVVMGKTSMPQQTLFDVNRPFLFLLRDQTTGNILFVGRISDPTVEGTDN